MYRVQAEDLTEREVEGELVIVQRSSGEVHQLNHVAAFIWQTLKQDPNETNLVDAVARHFEIDHQRAQDDVARFLTDLARLKLVVAVE